MTIFSGKSHVGLKIGFLTLIVLLSTGLFFFIREEIKTRNLILSQQEQLSQAKVELENVRATSDKIQKEQQESFNLTNRNSISATDLSRYLSGVVEIHCVSNDEEVLGSGSLFKQGGSFYILTNEHVIDGMLGCFIGTKAGAFNLNLKGVWSWNNQTDVAVVPLGEPLANADGSPNHSYSVLDLNFSIGALPPCDKKVSVGSPVAVIGYPATGVQNMRVGDFEGFEASQIVTNGIVSGYDDTVKIPQGNLFFENYFISAKIDSGNSGGIALSKGSQGLCKLGLPTWVKLGNYDTQGLVQNISNVTTRFSN